MKRNLRSHLMQRLFDDRGFALPFALFVLSVVAIFSTAGLWFMNYLTQRVELRIEILQARNLAHAGVASVISALEHGQTLQSTSVQNSDGVCWVLCNKIYGSGETYQVVASADTTAGAKSTATVYFDLLRQQVTSWSESP